MIRSRPFTLGARAITALALVVGTLAWARSANAQSCPSSCDLECRSCCSHWKLRGACPGGEMKDEGDYRTFDEAQRSADSRNRCAPGDAACEKQRNVCAGGTVAAMWAVACDAKDRLAPPGDSEARRALEPLGVGLAATAKSVDDTHEELATFARTRIIRDRGIPRAAAAVDAVRASRDRLRLLRGEHERLLMQATSAADARAFGERASAAIKAAGEAITAAKAVMNDPSIVDGAAEDRERRNAAALRARDEDEAKRQAAREAEEARRKAAIATAAEDARRRSEEAEQRRKEGEAARVAAAEASKHKLEEQQAQQQANAAASNADKKRFTEEKHAAATKGLAEIDVQLTTALAAVAGTLAVANISREQRARAQANEQRLKGLQARARDVRARADSSLHQAAPADGLFVMSRAEVELAVLAAEARSVVASTGAPSSSPSPAGAGGKDPAPVPACIVDLTAPAGVDGATVALDGAKPVPLPTKVRLSSGRHALVVAQGSRTARQSELIVCGRAQSVAVVAPK